MFFENFNRNISILPCNIVVDGNVTVKDFRKYEKLEYKNNKLKLGIDFPNKISFGEKKTISTLLVTCIMVIKSNY